MVAIRPGIAGLFSLAASLLVSTAVFAAPLPHPACQKVAEAILSSAKTMKSKSALLRLAPYMHPDSVPVLAERLRRERLPDFALWLALGGTQDASALMAVRGIKPTAALEDRVGHALSLLALGDGSETGTISWVLSAGPEPVRVQTATELTRLWGSRPRDLLYPALEDPSHSVRFVAAQHLSSWSTRARRALQDLAEGSDPRFRTPSLEALVDRGQRLPFERIQRLSEPYRSRALAKEASRGSSLALRDLRHGLKSQDPATRLASFALLAALGVESADSLRRAAEKSRPAKDYEPELSVARLLLGDRTLLSGLSDADAQGIARAIDVLWIFTSSKLKTANADAGAVAALLPLTEDWLIERRLPEVSATRLLRSVEALDAELAVRLSRRRILGPAGSSFERACFNLGRGGQTSDAGPLYSAAGRLSDEEAKSSALVAAARICAR